MSRGPDHERSARNAPKYITPDVSLVPPNVAETPPNGSIVGSFGRRVVDAFRWKQSPPDPAVLAEQPDWMASLNEAFSQPSVSHVRDTIDREGTPGISRRKLIAGTGAAIGVLLIASEAPLVKSVAESVWEDIVGKDRIPLEVAKNANEKKYLQLYNNMLKKFGRREDDLLKERQNGEFNSVAPIWSMSRVIDASFVGGMLSGEIGRLSREDHGKWLAVSNNYWSQHPNGFMPGYNPGPDSFSVGLPNRYNDDNLWMGLIHARRFKHEKSFVSFYRAQDAGNMVAYQYDGKHEGYPWKVLFPNETHRGKATVSNAPLIELAVELYKGAEDPKDKAFYQQRALATYQWMKDTLMDNKESALDDETRKQKETWRKKDGLFFDNIDENGRIGPEKWTYCQGAMIGALVKLSEMEPRGTYLAEAYNLATASLLYFDKVGYEGHSQYEEDNAFNAIFFKNLMYLATTIGNDSFQQIVKNTLHSCVDRLKGNEQTLLGYSGAVHLAALNCLDDSLWGLLA